MHQKVHMHARNNNYQGLLRVARGCCFVLDTSGWGMHCYVLFSRPRILRSTHAHKPTLSSVLFLTNPLVVLLPFFVLYNVSDQSWHIWACWLTSVISNQQQEMNWHFAGSVWYHRERETRQMDVDGLQTSQGEKTEAVSKRVCVGVFDVTPDSCLTQTTKR